MASVGRRSVAGPGCPKRGPCGPSAPLPARQHDEERSPWEHEPVLLVGDPRDGGVSCSAGTSAASVRSVACRPASLALAWIVACSPMRVPKGESVRRGSRRRATGDEKKPSPGAITTLLQVARAKADGPRYAADRRALFDPEQLVVLGDPVRSSGCASLDLAAVGGHREIGDGRVLGLARAVRDDRPVRRPTRRRHRRGASR